jgi:hypothetical protein
MKRIWAGKNMAVYIVLSVLAIYGLISLVNDIITRIKVGCNSLGGKLCLYPYPGDEGLEGKIRSFFLNEVTEKLGTDGFLYIKLEENDPNRAIVEKLCMEYPRLVLIDDNNWDRMRYNKEETAEEKGILQ